MPPQRTIEDLVTAWIDAEQNSLHDSAAIRALIHLPYEDADLCWSFIEAAHARHLSEKVRDALAAGPLEDLLVHFPQQIFPRVRALAERDDVFRRMLGSVWLDGNDSPIWREFYELAGTQPPFPPGWDTEA